MRALGLLALVALAAQPARPARPDKVLRCSSAPFEVFTATLADYREEDGFFSGVSRVFFRDNYTFIGDQMVCAGHHLEDLTCIGFVNTIPTAVAQVRVVRKKGGLFHEFKLLTAEPGEEYREKDRSWPCTVK